MKLFLLTEEEILRIRSFVEEASNISIVECIYLVSYFSDKRMREQIDIIAITNDSMHYNYMLTGKATYDGTLSEENDLKLIIDKYNEYTYYIAVVKASCYGHKNLSVIKKMIDEKTFSS